MMNIDAIIEKKPHLSIPLRFYEKVRKFEETVHELPAVMFNNDKIPISLEHVSYPSEYIKHIFGHFSALFEVPADMLNPLREAMELGRIDLTRLPLNEVPAFSLPYQENELAALLFLIGRPYFIWLRKKFNLDNMYWQEGKCPVCNSMPALASLKKDEGRTLHCPYCGGFGLWQRIGCPHCRNKNTDKLEAAEAEGEDGFRIYFCSECKSYLKTVESSLLEDYGPDLLDIVSMPLDIVAQGKGYRRFSPNPLGMTVMV